MILLQLINIGGSGGEVNKLPRFKCSPIALLVKCSNDVLPMEGGRPTPPLLLLLLPFLPPYPTSHPTRNSKGGEVFGGGNHLTKLTQEKIALE